MHLISGPLGTLVGLYETAIDQLCTWEVDGKKVRPKVIASTATIRQAGDQVHAPVPAEAERLPAARPGDRRQLLLAAAQVEREDAGPAVPRHLCPRPAAEGGPDPGLRRLPVGRQALYEKYGQDADPWMTLVGYFNTLRELGGMRRLVDDDVRTRLRKMADRGLANRTLYTPDTVKELTSRLGSTDIPEMLDRLESRFDPAILEEIKDAQGRAASTSPGRSTCCWRPT